MEDYAPPGINIKAEFVWFLTGIIAASTWSLLFLIRYLSHRNELFCMRAGRLVVMEGAVMVPFEVLTTGLFHLFGLVFVYELAMVVYHYFYHYQGSKMMYLMKRLPDKWEVHKRCLILPSIAFIITFVQVHLLKGIYYAIYLIFTPAQCLAI